MTNLPQLQKSLDNTILAYQRGRTVTTKRLHHLSNARLQVTLDSGVPAQYQQLLTDRMQQIQSCAFNQQH